MRLKNLSINAMTLLMLLLVGAASSVNVYFLSQSAFDEGIASQQQSLAGAIQVSAAERMADLVENASQLGQQIQKKRAFRAALKQGDPLALQEVVDQSFEEMFVTSGVLALAKVRVYDTQYRLVGSSSRGDSSVTAGLPEPLAEQVRQRADDQRMRIEHSLWRAPSGGQLSVLVPAGGLRLSGYVEVVVDPAYNLRTVADSLGLPVAIFDVDGDTPKQISENWVENSDQNQLTRVSARFPAQGETLYEIQALTDLTAFIEVMRFKQWRAVGTQTLIVLLSLLAAYALFKRRLIQPLQSITAQLQQFAEGDLQCAKPSQRDDEMGRLQNALADTGNKVGDSIAEVEQTGMAIGTASQQIAASSQELSRQTEVQASSLSETAASLEQMAASIAQNAEHASHCEQLAGKTVEQATEGGRAMSETVEAMHAIASKITLVEEIAYQTNLLSLNAAIESARAGDHGRGFAVVAGEVRKLAERSGRVSQEINVLAKDSVAVADRASDLVGNIVDQIGQTAALVRDVSQASKEQSGGVNQITQAMAELDAANQQSASTAEELAATTAMLNDQSDTLKQVIGRFRY